MCGDEPNCNLLIILQWFAEINLNSKVKEKKILICKQGNEDVPDVNIYFSVNI